MFNNIVFIRVDMVRSGTWTKKYSLVLGYGPPKIHCCGSILPALFFALGK